MLKTLKSRAVSLGHNAAGVEIALSDKLRQYHLHVLGQFGKGKSKFLEHLIRNDIIHQRGLCLLDPHGSLYDDLVEWCAAKGILGHRKFYLFEPKADSDWVFGFNPLDFRGLSKERRTNAVEAMVKACAQVWGGEDLTKTPRLARILPAILHVLSEKDLTLLEALCLCSPAGHSPSQEAVRRAILENIEDVFYRGEWEYFEGLTDARYIETFESTRNRLSAFLRNPVLRATVGQSVTALDFRAVMDEGAIVLVNLSHLTIDSQRLLGTLLVNDLHTRALDREVGKSRPFHLYLDEAYRFLTSDVAGIVVGTRKFGLWLTLAHHNLEQLRSASEEIYANIMQIPNRVVFGGVLPLEDARELAELMYLGTFDFEEAKHQYDKPVIVGYVREYFSSYSSATGRVSSRGGSSSLGGSSGTSETVTQSMDDPTPEAGSISTGSSEGSSFIETGSWNDTESWSETEGKHETLVPLLKTMPTTPYSLQEHVHRATATIVNQPTQRAVVKLSERHPDLVKIPTIRKAFARPERVEKFKEEANMLSPSATPKALAEKQIDERRCRLQEAATSSKRIGKSPFVPDKKKHHLD